LAAPLLPRIMVARLQHGSEHWPSHPTTRVGRQIRPPPPPRWLIQHPPLP
jgi:hypothetical protein